MTEPIWKIVYTKQALKDREHAFENGFQDKIVNLLVILRNNPFEPYPPYEKLIGELHGAYSRRINHQHRFVYTVYEDKKIIKVVSLWEHY